MKHDAHTVFVNSLPYSKWRSTVSKWRYKFFSSADNSSIAKEEWATLIWILCTCAFPLFNPLLYYILCLSWIGLKKGKAKYKIQLWYNAIYDYGLGTEGLVSSPHPYANLRYRSPLRIWTQKPQGSSKLPKALVGDLSSKIGVKLLIRFITEGAESLTRSFWAHSNNETLEWHLLWLWITRLCPSPDHLVDHNLTFWVAQLTPLAQETLPLSQLGNLSNWRQKTNTIVSNLWHHGQGCSESIRAGGWYHSLWCPACLEPLQLD